MKILSIAILFNAAWMVCVLTKADSLEFAKKSLDLEIGAATFGAPIAKFDGAKRVASAYRPNGAVVDWTGVEWYQTKESAAYEAGHPGRFLLYGFRNGQLIALHFKMWGFDRDAEQVSRIRESITSIFTEFKRLSGNRLIYQDQSLRVLFTPYCNPTQNDFAVIVLTPPVKD